MRGVLFAIAMLLFTTLPAIAQDKGLQSIFTEQHEAIEKPSRSSVDALAASLLKSGLPEARVFLEKWRDREVWMRKADGAFFLAKPNGDNFQLLDIASGNPVASASKDEVEQIKPNAGVKAVVSSALVQFQLADPEAKIRGDALDAIEKDPQAP